MCGLLMIGPGQKSLSKSTGMSKKNCNFGLRKCYPNREMKNFWRKIVLISGLALALSASSLHARTSWESVRTERVTEAKSVLRTTELEVKASRGQIFVTTTRPVQVKVFSILGQLVSQENIPAGTSRLALGAHGIYIVKIGDLTCKVAL